MTKPSNLFAAVVLAASMNQAVFAADPPEAAKHVERARALAGQEFADSFRDRCQAENLPSMVNTAVEGSKHWLPPTKAFDDLYYVGSEFVGVWVVRTSEGLILIDSTGSAADARDHLVPGIQALGFDPKSIRYVLVTHAHWDHYGGAQYLHDTYGARVGLTAEDWDTLDQLPAGGVERAPTFGDDRSDRTPPKRDLIIHDGDKLTLGDHTLTLYVAPGHTPGTLAALIPVHEGGKEYVLSLLGGTAFPRTLEPANHMGGLRAFSTSVERLSKLSQDAGAVGLLNTHIFVDGSMERLAAARARQPGQPNPFVLGTKAVARYYGMFDECLKAAEARPMKQVDVRKLLTPKATD